MNRDTLSKISEILSPTEEQKERMFHNILEGSEHKAMPMTRSKSIYKRLMPIAACLVLMLTITTIANAATGGAVFDGIKQFFFSSGAKITMQETDVGFNIGADNTKPDWLVKESWGRLILNVNGEKINITDAISDNGYYYYDYLNDDETLHRIYIIENVDEEAAERRYSQIEWLPEIGIGSTRGCGVALAHVIGEVEACIKEDDTLALDSILSEYLQIYRDEMGNFDRIFERIGE